MTKQIVITGVSRGLGLALVEGFIAKGHTVIGCARSKEAIARLQEQFGNPHAFAVVDVADDSQVAAWATQTLAAYGSPDLLINNAAVINSPAPLWQVPSETFDQLIAVNINGVANVIRHFVPAMVAKQRGIIVNLSSGWGRSTAPDVAPYCASKWAIEGLTRALAQELPAGMAAIPLNPGIIHTEMLDICFGAEAIYYTKIEDWQRQAIPFLLKLTPAQNGMPLTVPG